MHKARGPILLAMGTTAAIVVASILPAASKQDLHVQGLLHPWLHLSAFGFLTILLLMAINSTAMRVLAISAVILLAFGTEFIEHLIVNVPIETIDVITDVAGVVAGFLFVGLTRSSS